MDKAILVELLEGAARSTFGSGVAGWASTLGPLAHDEVTNELWTAQLDGTDVFVKRYRRQDRYRNELAALQVAREAGLRVPDEVLRIDDLDVLVLARLPGTLLAVAWPGMSWPGRLGVTADAGRLAARLHQATPGTGFGARAAPGLVDGADWDAYMDQCLARWISAVSDLDIAIRWSSVEEALSRYLADEAFATTPSLTHSDISPRNLIVSGPGTGPSDAPGLLDWELARYDHPCMDFHNSMGAKWLEYDDRLVQAFWQGVASVADAGEIAGYKRHHDFFMAIVTLSTIAYLARIGIPPQDRPFLNQQATMLRRAMVRLGARE